MKTLIIDDPVMNYTITVEYNKSNHNMLFKVDILDRNDNKTHNYYFKNTMQENINFTLFLQQSAYSDIIEYSKYANAATNVIKCILKENGDLYEN